jgi:anti-sigma regulatory factor (Ser/Thr protein kinase)
MRFTYLLNGDARQLRDLRVNLEAWMNPAAPDVDDLVIVTNELAANALSYGKAPILVTVAHRERELRIQVTQQTASTSPTRPYPHLVHGHQGQGRGLVLVNALARDWGWSQSEQQLVVWAVLALPGNLSQ